nr:glycerol-3-phosphate dehydrogenase C-terminal domain-containing protein [Amylibacter sp.]
MGKPASVDFDLAILGGGPLACAIARDAAGRGLRVLLSAPGDLGGSVEQHILASGLALLSPEQGPSAFEMDVMQRVCPQFGADIEPSGPKPSLMQRLLGAAPTPAAYSLRATAASRFALLNARDAADRGAVMLPLTTADIRTVGGSSWQLDVASKAGGPLKTVSAKILVDTLQDETEMQPDQLARIGVYAQAGAKGRNTAQNACFRVESDAGTVAIGVLAAGPPSGDDLAKAALAFGIADAPTWMSDPLSVPLPPKPLEISNSPPRLVIRDGAAGDWRKQAEDVVAEMAPFARMIGKRWTAFATLPGGDFQRELRSNLIADLRAAFPHITPGHLERLFSHYGTDCAEILKSSGGLGHDFGAGLFEAEVRWLLLHEWARTARDILWRRTGLGVRMTADQMRALDQWIAQNSSGLQQA